MENILLVVSNSTYINLKSNVMLNYSRNFLKRINSNPGYLVLANRTLKKLYVSKIESIEDKKHIAPLKTAHQLSFKINNNPFKVFLKEELQEVSFEILKLLYSNGQSNNIGNETFSIYSTIRRGKFNFARPTIHNIESFYSKLEEGIFKEKLLYKNSIFSSVGEGNIYGELLEEDNQFFFSLTNEKMLEEDFMFLETRNSYYRPYFYEFYIDGNIDSLKNIYPEIEIGGLYEIEISEGFQERFLNGELIFSASPSITKLANLKIVDKLSENQRKLIIKNENLIRGFISVTEDESIIENSVMKYLPEWTKLEYEFDISVYNVGQGNWINIKVISSKNEKMDIVFDIGIGNSNDSKLIKKIASKAAVDLEDNHMFILSHWDLDHIKGITYLTKEQFETTWIVPELPKKVSFAALRLASYLKCRSEISEIFVSEKFNNKLIFKNKIFMLGKGEGLDINVPVLKKGHKYYTSYNSNNNIGLLLSIEYDKENPMLFSGDCEYIQFPDEFLKSYSSILVSHHGAKIKVSDLKQIGLLSSTKKDSKAIVCVGKKTEYPSDKHIESIKKLGYQLVETRKYDDIHSPIKINISSKFITANLV